MICMHFCRHRPTYKPFWAFHQEVYVSSSACICDIFYFGVIAVKLALKNSTHLFVCTLISYIRHCSRKLSPLLFPIIGRKNYESN